MVNLDLEERLVEDEALIDLLGYLTEGTAAATGTFRIGELWC
jgi:hypothetical protein